MQPIPPDKEILPQSLIESIENIWLPEECLDPPMEGTFQSFRSLQSLDRQPGLKVESPICTGHWDVPAKVLRINGCPVLSPL